MKRTVQMLLLLAAVNPGACRMPAPRRASPVPLTPAALLTTADTGAAFVHTLTIKDYDALLTRIGWSEEAISAKTLSPSGQMLVIAAFPPDPAGTTNYAPPSMHTDRAAPNLYLIHATGQWKTLTTDDGYYGGICFEPSGSRIAYMSQQGVSAGIDPTDAPPPVAWALYVQDVGSGERKKIYEDRPVPLWTNDVSEAGAGLLGWIPGTHDLLYGASHNAGLWDVSGDGARPRLVTAYPPTLLNYDPKRKDWRAEWKDARHHTFRYADVTQNLRVLSQPSYWRNLTGTKPFYLPDFPDSTQLLSPSSDRKRLPAMLFCSALPGGQRAGDQHVGEMLLAVLELPTLQVRVLGVAPHGGYGGFGWAADGLHLLCSQLVPNRPDRIYQCDVSAITPQPMRHVNWRTRKQARFTLSQLAYAP